MRKIKYIIPIVLLFMVIGFATITTSLSINADMELLGDLDDFVIYYSGAVVNGEEDPSIIVSSTELDFGAALKEVGTPYEIEYDITNASSSFDAEIEMTCTGSTEYFEISNDFDTSTPLGARQTRTGTLTLMKIKTLAGDAINSTVSCTVVATPIERNSESSNTIPAPLENPLYVGREIAIGDEKFNIISIDADTVTLLAQYNLGTNYRQSTTENYVMFSDTDGWEYTPGPKEIDIQTWSTDSKIYVNSYVTYLQGVTGDNTLTGDLITMAQLRELGCTIPSDYAWVIDASARTCANSPYGWVVNGQSWWTRSASSAISDFVWNVSPDGALNDDIDYSLNYGVRPVITISKETAFALIKYKMYNIGEEISIGNQTFNVISQTPSTVTMLAQSNLGTYYIQGPPDYVAFSDGFGWEYAPGPKEIDIQTWSTYPKKYVNAYVEFLKEELGDDNVTGDLITLGELKGLGCTINDDYSSATGLTCANSPYGWIVNGQSWWTRSAGFHYESVWSVSANGSLSLDSYTASRGVRPVITISKSALSSLA